VGLTTLHHENKLVTKNLTEPRTWTDSLGFQMTSLSKFCMHFLSLSYKLQLITIQNNMQLQLEEYEYDHLRLAYW
jgi:hypothetical protein